MRQLFTAIVACASCLGAQGQIATVSSPEPLLRGVQSEMYNPVLSPDGTKLLFSRPDYSDLRLYDFELGVTVRIADGRGAGLEARFDADSRHVTYMKSTTGPDGLTLRSVEKYDISGRTTETLAPAARRQTTAAMRSGSTSVRTYGDRLYITTGGVEREYSPVEAAGYVWASLSPDGSKVMFVAAGKGVYITDLSGNIVSYAGRYEAPVWYGNDHIVAQLSTDDGHQYRSSQIILARADGTASQAITRPESMTFSPAACMATGTIVYSTIDGLLYRVGVVLK